MKVAAAFFKRSYDRGLWNVIRESKKSNDVSEEEIVLQDSDRLKRS